MKKYMLSLVVLLVGSYNGILGLSPTQAKRLAEVWKRQAERKENNGIHPIYGSTDWHEMAELCGTDVKLSYLPDTDPRLPNYAGETPEGIARERLERFGPGTEQYFYCEIVKAAIVLATMERNYADKNQ